MGPCSCVFVAADDVLLSERYRRSCTLTWRNARSSLCEKTLYTHLDTYQQMLAHLSCVLQWMLIRRCDSACVHKGETHACLWQRTWLWPVIRPVSDSRAKQFHTSYHGTFRSSTFFPACPVVGFGRPQFIIVVHDGIVEIGRVLHVHCGGSCPSQGHVFSCFCRQRYVLTDHVCGYIRIFTVFIKNEAHCSLIRSLGKVLSCRHMGCTC